MTQTRHEAAVAEAISEQKETIEALGQKYSYGWHDSDEAGRRARRGLDEDVVRHISAAKGEPEWMLKRRLKALRLFERRPMPRGGPTSRSSTSMSTSTSSAPRTNRRLPGRTCLKTSRTRTTAWGSPRPRRPGWSPGVAAQYESEVVYNQIRDDLEQQGVVFPRHRFRPQAASRARPRALRQRWCRGGQQVRLPQHRCVVGRILHLRTQGRARGHPAPGLFPHQHGVDGAVRAHPHHRRRGLLRPLRRGAARRRSTSRTPCTRPSSRSSSRGTPTCATRRSRTGRTTSSTS